MAPALNWQPRPDPAVHDSERPGLRPHRHPPGKLHPWVFLQDEIWVDYWGKEEVIALMAGAYVANVIAFCEERAPLIFALVAQESVQLHLDNVESAEAEMIYVRALSTDLLPILSFRETVDTVGWLHTLPLLRALDGRESGSADRDA